MKFSRFFLIIILVLASCNVTENPVATTPTGEAIMHSGSWIGTFTEIKGRTLDMTMDVTLNGTSISGEIQKHDEGVFEVQRFTGKVLGTKVQFKDMVNHLYWGTLSENGIEGFVGWECFECTYWGTFKLQYIGPLDHIDLIPFSTPVPDKSIEILPSP